MSFGLSSTSCYLKYLTLLRPLISVFKFMVLTLIKKSSSDSDSGSNSGENDSAETFDQQEVVQQLYKVGILMITNFSALK